MSSIPITHHSEGSVTFAEPKVDRSITIDSCNASHCSVQISKPIFIVCLLPRGGYHYCQALVSIPVPKHKYTSLKPRGPPGISADSNAKLIILYFHEDIIHLVTTDLTLSNPVLV